MNGKVLNLRLDPETHKDLEYMAEDQHCSVQEIITSCLESWALAKKEDMKNDRS